MQKPVDSPIPSNCRAGIRGCGKTSIKSTGRVLLEESYQLRFHSRKDFGVLVLYAGDLSSRSLPLFLSCCQYVLSFHSLFSLEPGLLSLHHSSFFLLRKTVLFHLLFNRLSYTC